MALQVNSLTPTPYGTTVPSVYWRWCGLGIDVTTAQATVVLHGYVDGQAFADKKAPVAVKQITLSGDEFAAMAVAIETPGNAGLSAVIYDKVKQLDGFTTATDV